jgi:predicted transposase/invertase (TIGR01784 family)
LPENDRIVSLSFKNNEQLGQNEFDRKAIYDIYCENEKGEKFIVELQKAKQNYFKERTIYYSTFPIQEQAERGECLPDYAIQAGNYNLKTVYCIGILDFTFEDYETEPEKSEVIHTIKLKNQNGKTFYDKLTYIYLEMPNFNKIEADLKTRIEQWLYFIKHLEDFQTIPAIFNDEVFSKAFEKAEIAKYGAIELDKYADSLKSYRDLKGVIDTAFDEGKLEGKLETAKSFKKLGVSIEIIIEATGLTKEEIEKL